MKGFFTSICNCNCNSCSLRIQRQLFLSVLFVLDLPTQRRKTTIFHTTPLKRGTCANYCSCSYFVGDNSSEAWGTFSAAGIWFLDILQLPGWLAQYTSTSSCINCMYRVLRLGSHYRRLHLMQLGCGLIVL